MSRGVWRPGSPIPSGRHNENRSDHLALLEIGKEDAVDGPRRKPGETGFGHRQPELVEILTVADRESKALNST